MERAPDPQIRNTLFVVYSRFYLGRCRVDKPVDQMTPEERDQLCPGLKSPEQGIKLAEIDLTHLDSLPQVCTHARHAGFK